MVLFIARGRRREERPCQLLLGASRPTKENILLVSSAVGRIVVHVARRHLSM
ncbi:hypothetical protein Hdeb2414_s0758g00943831 [Helianthus debilis subsp. tardiflorus]